MSVDLNENESGSCTGGILMISCVSINNSDIGGPNPAGGSMEVSPGSWNVNGSGYDISVST